MQPSNAVTDPCEPIGNRTRGPLPALPAVQATIDGQISGPLLRTRTGAGMDRRLVHRYVARTAQVAGISRPIGPHALRRTVGTVRLNQGIPLRDM